MTKKIKIVIVMHNIDPEVAAIVRARDRRRCQVLGCNETTHLHIHHILPRSRGGQDNPENLILLCARHHDEIELAGIMDRNLIINYPDPDPPIPEPSEAVETVRRASPVTSDGKIILDPTLPGLMLVYEPPSWVKWVYGSERNPGL